MITLTLHLVWVSIQQHTLPLLQALAGNQSLEDISQFLNLGVDWVSLTKVLVQVAIASLLLYVIYNSLIRRSQAEKMLRGLFLVLVVLIGFWGFSRWAGFSILEILFGDSIRLLIIGLIVIFQPELRRLMNYLGQADWFASQGGLLSSESRKTEYLIQQLTDAVRYMSKTKTGSLMVLETEKSPSGVYLEAGTPLDAMLSTELLLTIFHTNAPLHDGAVLINPENRVVSAGVLLPLTEDPTLSWRYGTRHRAAIGLSEVSDAICIVTSEETGSISYIQNGVIERLEGSDDLQKRLERVLHVSVKPTKKRRLPLVKQPGGEWLEQENTSENFFYRFLGRILSSDAHNVNGGEAGNKNKTPATGGRGLASATPGQTSTSSGTQHNG